MPSSGPRVRPLRDIDSLGSLPHRAGCSHRTRRRRNAPRRARVPRFAFSLASVRPKIGTVRISPRVTPAPLFTRGRCAVNNDAESNGGHIFLDRPHLPRPGLTKHLRNPTPRSPPRWRLKRREGSAGSPLTSTSALMGASGRGGALSARGSLSSSALKERGGELGALRRDRRGTPSTHPDRAARPQSPPGGSRR